MIREVRNTWQFFRDRLPGSWEQLVAIKSVNSKL